jgi:hypothetical protein
MGIKDVVLKTICQGEPAESSRCIDVKSPLDEGDVKDLGGRVVLIERDEMYCEIAARRIGEAQKEQTTAAKD